MLTAPQLLGYYPDLQDARTSSALALVHSRFSTNTFPSWELAHPYRMIAHNGEINTLRGNVNWMRARESQLASALFGDDLEKVLPVVRPGGSDSATLDNVLELLVLAGRSLPHALMMMVPEAWEERDDLPEHLRAFYAFHSCLMEPWDGPAAICVHRRARDRRDARPQRPAPGPLAGDARTAGSCSAPRPACSTRPARTSPARGRLQPGKLFLVDLERGRIVADDEVKARGRDAASRTATGTRRASSGSPTCPTAVPRVARSEPLRTRQLAFGWTPGGPAGAARADGARGPRSRSARWATTSRSPCSPTRRRRCSPTSSSCSRRSRTRRSTRSARTIVMSVATGVGSERNLLAEAPEHAHQLEMAQPILRNAELEPLRRVDSSVFRAHTIDITWPRRRTGAEGLERALRARSARRRRRWSRTASTSSILSDRRIGRRARADPVAAGRRRRPPPPRPRGHAPAGRARARVRRAARGPPLRHADRLRRGGDQPVPDVRVGRRDARERTLPGERRSTQAERNVVKAIGKGLLKTISKMGISTIQSYNGAQIFEAVGLAPRADRRATSPAPRRGSAASASTCWRRGARAPRARLRRRARLRCAPSRDGDDARTRGLLPSAASTRGGATASTASGTRRRSPSCSTRSATAAGRPTRSSPRDMNEAAARRAVAARADGVPLGARTAASRSTRSSRRPRSSSASPPARCRSARCRARRTRRSRSR